MVENIIWGRGLAENVKIPSYGDLKLLKKPSIDIFLEYKKANLFSIIHNYFG